jgi:hypothetical protein
MQFDLAAMQTLPAAPFEACDLRSGYPAQAVLL